MHQEKKQGKKTNKDVNNAVFLKDTKSLLRISNVN